MDSLTQIALGAAVGEATLGRTIGNKAPLWGGIVATIPDLDIIPGQFLGIVEQQLFHRGFSHSIAFFLILSPLLAYLMQWLYRTKIHVRFAKWMIFFFLVLFTHALLDCTTTWGTQLFWPLDYRIAIQSIFVIDPLYTIPLAITTISLLFVNRERRTRFWLNWAGLGLSTLYLLFTFVNKQVVNDQFEEALSKQDIQFTDYRTQPTPLNSILWSATVEAANGFYIGYYSLLDDTSAIDFHFVPKNHELLSDWRNYPRVQLLTKVAKGYFTIEQAEDGIILNDLRFGQPLGWHNPDSEFVFSYHIRHRQNAKKAQEIRITKNEGDIRTSESLFQAYWARILGKRS